MMPVCTRIKASSTKPFECSPRFQAARIIFVAWMTTTWEQQLTASRLRHLIQTAGKRFVYLKQWRLLSVYDSFLGWAVTAIRMSQSLQQHKSAKSCYWNPLAASKQLCERGLCCIYWHCMWMWALHIHGNKWNVLFVWQSPSSTQGGAEYRFEHARYNLLLICTSTNPTSIHSATLIPQGKCLHPLL